jgi:hypothetical protein
MGELEQKYGLGLPMRVGGRDRARVGRDVVGLRGKGIGTRHWEEEGIIKAVLGGGGGRLKKEGRREGGIGWESARAVVVVV